MSSSWWGLVWTLTLTQEETHETGEQECMWWASPSGISGQSAMKKECKRGETFSQPPEKKQLLSVGHLTR